LVEWTVVAAFVGPLIAAMGLLGAWFAWIGKRREQLIRGIVQQSFEALNSRLTIVENTLANQNKQLDKQDTALAQAMTAVARIEGRLMADGPGPGH
jgi:uncharacterized membrane protein YccC